MQPGKPVQTLSPKESEKPMMKFVEFHLKNANVMLRNQDGHVREQPKSRLTVDTRATRIT